MPQNDPVTHSREDTMTYRSIFVHADDSEACDRRLATAASIARAYPAQLKAAYLVPTSQMTPFASAVLRGDAKDRWFRQTAEAHDAVRARFHAIAADAGVADASWVAPRGDPIAAAVLHARYSDLAIIGQPPRDEVNAAFSAELANAAVTSSGRPVLFVPYIGSQKTLGERVLIAWKDSRESARAVADALPFLKDAKKVHALAIMQDDDADASELRAEKGVAAFLKRHDVDATVRRLVAPDIEAGELLLSQASDLGVDLIVMGGYSRPRLTQLVWGGVTSVMLASMTVPVLMSH
jgi:nucleotide-binding universal stress UspA family protein